jgi:hypothetical protein
LEESMMKAFVLAAVAAAAVLAVLPASADPTSPTVPATVVVPQHTFIVRLDKPHVVIDIKTPSAASAAGAAHESMRAWMMRQYEPAMR